MIWKKSMSARRPSVLVAQIFLVLSYAVCRGQAPQPPDELKKLRQDLADSKTEVTEIRSLLRQRQFLGMGGVPASDFMPPPADPTNPFFNEMNATDTNLGAGIRVLGTGLIFRAAGTGSVLLKYDTGLLNSGVFDPSLIAIGGSKAKGAGSFGLAGFGGSLKFDLNAALSQEEQAQAYLDTDYLENELHIRQAFGRVQLTTINVLAGSYWTAWGDEGTIPKSISVGNGFPAGAISAPSVPQLRFAVPFGNGWVTTLALQQPLPGDFALRDTDVALHRYPDVAARLRYFDGDFLSISLGAFVRFFGRENDQLNEQFEPGWGAAATTRFRTSGQGALMLGGVFGEGIAGTVFGLRTALAAETSFTNDLAALRNYGGYAGYQHQWQENLLTTIAYGIAQTDGATTAVKSARSAQNAWANVIYRVNDNFALGLQYEYGVHELFNGTSGNNHRLSAVVSIAIGVREKSSAESMMRALPPEQADAFRSVAPQAVPQDLGASKFRRM